MAQEINAEEAVVAVTPATYGRKTVGAALLAGVAIGFLTARYLAKKAAPAEEVATLPAATPVATITVTPAA